MMKKSKGAARKEESVNKIAKMISKYKYILLSEASGLPSSTLERMRKLLGEKVLFLYAQKVIIYKALQKAGSNLAEKVKEIKIPLLLLSNTDPFEIAKIIRENKEYSKIKAGQVAVEDIILPAGPTPFPPGPMLSQFSSIGVKTKTEGGKISIVNDTVVLKKGEKADEKIAAILSSMDIRPNEVMINIVFATDGKVVFPHELLFRSTEDYINDIKDSFSRAFYLSIGAGILNRYSIIPIIKKLYIGVRFLSVNRNIITKSTIKDLLLKAASQAAALSGSSEVK